MTRSVYVHLPLYEFLTAFTRESRRKITKLKCHFMNANNIKMLNRCLRDKKQAETRLAKIDKNWKQQKTRFQSLQDKLNELVINTKDFDLLNQQI